MQSTLQPGTPGSREALENMKNKTMNPFLKKVQKTR